MWVMTFHSACVRILRREAPRFGYPSSFSIYDQADSQRLMALVCRELDLDAKQHPPKAMLAQVSNLKNELVDYETFLARADRRTGRRPWPRRTPSTSAAWSPRGRWTSTT